MQALARFAMTGRYRALLIAIASSGSVLFAWVGAATVALVTLRKGPAEGLWVLLWASLPALILTRVTGDSSALVLLLGTGLMGFVLRATISLPLTALASAGVALLTAAGLLVFGEGFLLELARVFGEFFATLETQNREAGGRPLGLTPPTLGQLAGMMGTANGALSFLCLALARHWQASLYNPGGFGEEFRALRLAPMLVALLVAVAAAIASMGLAYRSWAAALLLPLTIAGFALIHARVRIRGKGSVWLGGLYAAWLIFDAAKLALVGLVVADAIMDFRRRWPGASGNDDDDDNGNGDDSRDDSRDDNRDDNDMGSGGASAQKNGAERLEPPEGDERSTDESSDK